MQVFKFSLGVIFGDISGGTSQGDVSEGYLREHLRGSSQRTSRKGHLRGDISKETSQGVISGGRGYLRGDISWDISGGVSFVDSEFTQSNFCQTRQRRSLTSHNL